MNKRLAISVAQRHPIVTSLFLFGTLLSLLLLIPKMGTTGEHASGCPYMAASKGSGCPYMAEAKGCLHALKYSLKLGEDQMSKVREIQGEFLEESADLKESIRKTAADLDTLFRDPEASPENIMEKRKSLAGIKEKLEAMAMDFRLRIRAEMTDDQLRQIPAGCWHGVLAYGHGGDYGCGHGCKCPYRHKHAHPDDASA